MLVLAIDLNIGLPLPESYNHLLLAKNNEA